MERTWSRLPLRPRSTYPSKHMLRGECRLEQASCTFSRSLTGAMNCLKNSVADGDLLWGYLAEGIGAGSRRIHRSVARAATTSPTSCDWVLSATSYADGLASSTPIGQQPKVGGSSARDFFCGA